MICTFCNKQTTDNDEHFNYCYNCHENVNAIFAFINKELTFIQISPTIPNDYYPYIWLKKNIVTIYHDHDELISLPIFNLTPQNYNNKLKTILTFL